MDRVFKSKVGWWYHLLIGLLVVACIMVVLSQNVLAMIGVFAVTMFVLHVFFNTYYVITTDGLLIVRSGIFPAKTIPITEIEALEPSIFPTFSYALSLNRIIVWRNGQMWMLISPENRKEFINLLKQYNPDIELRTHSTII